MDGGLIIGSKCQSFPSKLIFQNFKWFYTKSHLGNLMHMESSIYIYIYAQKLLHHWPWLSGRSPRDGWDVCVCLLTGISPDNYMVKSCFGITDLDHARKGTDRSFKILILPCLTQDYLFKKSFVTLVAVLFLLFKGFSDKFQYPAL